MTEKNYKTKKQFCVLVQKKRYTLEKIFKKYTNRLDKSENMLYNTTNDKRNSVRLSNNNYKER